MAKKQVLIVEDQSKMALLIKDMLDELGYGVAGPVSSGKEAIQETLTNPPDLILMDIKLEDEMDGVEAARQIQEKSDIPIVYITGHAEDDLLERAKLTEPYGYIMKPFVARDLHINIEFALYRHKMERLAKENERRYKAVCELTSDYIFHIKVGKEKQMLLDWSTKGLARLTGYTINEVKSPELWNKIFHPDDISRIDEAFKNLIQGNQEKYECRIITKEGETLWLIVNARPEWDIKKEDVIGIVGAASNITESKHSEEALMEAKNKAEVANRAKSEFLANISHELKTPLNSIIGFSEILIDKSFGEINEKQEKYLNNIHKSGNHLLEMINDIIDLSKAEAGKKEPELKEFSLPLIINDTVATLKPAAIKKNIEIKTYIEEKLSTINADEAKLRKIINILLDNAVKFTPDGGMINIEAKKISDLKDDQDSKKRGADHRTDRTGAGRNPECIEMSVTDAGIGIEHKDQERIFKGFEQADSSFKRKHSGTGLGLALAKKLVEMHGGEIRVESPPKKGMALEEGKGSSFIFVIPCSVGVRQGGQA